MGLKINQKRLKRFNFFNYKNRKEYSKSYHKRKTCKILKDIYIKNWGVNLFKILKQLLKKKKIEKLNNPELTKKTIKKAKEISLKYNQNSKQQT